MYGINKENKLVNCKKPCGGKDPWKKIASGFKEVHGSWGGAYGIKNNYIVYYRDKETSNTKALVDKSNSEHLKCKYVASSGGFFFCLTLDDKLKYCKEPFDGNFVEIDTSDFGKIKYITATANGWPSKEKEKTKFVGSKMKDTIDYTNLKDAMSKCDTLPDCIGINKYVPKQTGYIRIEALDFKAKENGYKVKTTL